MSNLFVSHRLAALAIALATCFGSAAAQAADFTVTGHLGFNTDVVLIGFDLAAPGNVNLTTDSWMSGLNFDPTLSVFNSNTTLIATGDDTADPALLRPGQGGFDSSIDLPSLAAGHYTLSLSASGNDPLGTTLAAGFSLVGTTPIAIADWNQPGYDINTNDQKGSFWRVQLAGVDSIAAPVPEPGSWALMAAGLLGLAGFVRQRRSAAGDQC